VVGVLPFMEQADVVELGGTVVIADMPVSVWPATSDRTSDVGRHHTHGGQAPLEHADELEQPNRALEYAGDTYRIVGATPMPLMAHVVLDLVRTAGTS
jgi:hypothetical protein